MAAWLQIHWGSLVVGLVLLAVVCAIVVHMFHQRRAGQGGCGCGCADCPSKGICHGEHHASHKKA